MQYIFEDFFDNVDNDLIDQEDNVQSDINIYDYTICFIWGEKSGHHLQGRQREAAKFNIIINKIKSACENIFNDVSPIRVFVEDYDESSRRPKEIEGDIDADDLIGRVVVVDVLFDFKSDLNKHGLKLLTRFLDIIKPYSVRLLRYKENERFLSRSNLVQNIEYNALHKNLVVATSPSPSIEIMQFLRLFLSSVLSPKTFFDILYSFNILNSLNRLFTQNFNQVYEKQFGFNKIDMNFGEFIDFVRDNSETPIMYNYHNFMSKETPKRLSDMDDTINQIISKYSNENILVDILQMNDPVTTRHIIRFIFKYNMTVDFNGYQAPVVFAIDAIPNEKLNDYIFKTLKTNDEL